MPLNFIYKKHGTYTLTFDTEAIECDYLHLIDNGTSTLQVFDILGRQILTKEISTLNSQLPYGRVCAAPLQWQRRENAEDCYQVKSEK